MRNYRIAYFFFIVSTAITVLSCSSKSDSGSSAPPPNPCAGVSITVSGTVTNASAAGSNNGSISASATGGSGFTFSINGGAFQSSGSFTGLATGNYSITAKDSRGCTGSNSFTIAVNDACASVNFTVSGTGGTATPCLTTPNGSITVTTSGGGSGFTYNINGGAFQASATFNNLAPGNYAVGAKEAGGCTKTASVTINPTSAGPLFSAVRTILLANCALSGCHIGPSPTGGHDFTQDCEIVSNAALIKTKAVDSYGTANQMPPPPNAGLNATDRAAITNWVTAGGSLFKLS